MSLAGSALPADTALLWQTLLEDVRAIGHQHPDAVLASSMAAEDMVLTHAIHTAAASIGVFTLDTGRLHAQTLAMLDTIEARYGIRPTVYYPDAEAVQAHVREHGTHAFYESVELRKACCGLRKVEPLRRALRGRGAWVTGQRREQAATRDTLAPAEDDAVFGLRKFNPLAVWTHADVWRVIRALGVPYNPLHDEGYPSIGCEPCTRPVRAGEDLRAGRWWWESASGKECGLHAGNLFKPS